MKLQSAEDRDRSAAFLKDMNHRSRAADQHHLILLVDDFAQTSQFSAVKNDLYYRQEV